MEARLNARESRPETSASSYLFNSPTLNHPFIWHPLRTLGWMWRPWDPMLQSECQQPNSREHSRLQCSIVGAEEPKRYKLLESFPVFSLAPMCTKLASTPVVFAEACLWNFSYLPDSCFLHKKRLRSLLNLSWLICWSATVRPARPGND
jgi:hypothetical protein